MVATLKIIMIFAKYMMTYWITNWSSPQLFTYHYLQGSLF